MSVVTKLQGVTKLTKNPAGSSKLDGSLGIELGTMLELEVGGQVVRMGRVRPALLWFPAWKSLVFFEGVKRGSRTEANLRRLEDEMSTAKSTNTFERWAQRSASKASDITFPAGKRQWYAGGKANRLDYRSDKWGKTDEYTHDFGAGVRLYVLQKGRSAAMWVIRGGKMTVTQRGIVR